MYFHRPESASVYGEEAAAATTTNIGDSNVPLEIKRTRHETKTYNVIRRTDRQQQQQQQQPRLSRSRPRLSSGSRDFTAVANSISSTNHSTLLNKSEAVDAMTAVICDSGGYTIKIGRSTDQQPRLIPNCIMKAKAERKRLFIGNQIDECRDCSGLFFLLPCEKGFVTKWDVQKPIWDHIFNKNCCPLTNDLPLIMTQPLMNFKSIQECMDEIFFEEYEVSAMIRVNPSDLAMLHYLEDIGAPPDTPCLVIDTGFSFTHAVPYIDGKKYFKGTKRLNVGGKLLTNHLKDIISYRQYHVMEETYVINQVKEDTCYVSENFKDDLRIASSSGSGKNSIVRNYVLPDFNSIRRGYVETKPDRLDEAAENCQILRLNNERFTVPEILFHPSDIGIKSIGIAELIVKSIGDCPMKYQRKLARNIVVCGGNAKFPGFKARLYAEVRALLTDSWDINIYQADDPITYSWQGGKSLIKSADFQSKLVTKDEYDEMGSAGCQLKFNYWAITDNEESTGNKNNNATIIGNQDNKEVISLIEHVKKYSDVFGNTADDDDDPAKTGNDDDDDLMIDKSDDATTIQKKLGVVSTIESSSPDVIASTSSSSSSSVVVLDNNSITSATTTNNNSSRKLNQRSNPIVYSFKIISSDNKRV